jgi:hypothetical protein
MLFPFPPFQAASSLIPVFQDHASRIWGSHTPKASSRLGAVCRLMSRVSPSWGVSLRLAGHPLGVPPFAAKPRPALPASHSNHHPLPAGGNPVKNSPWEVREEQTATLPRPNILQHPPILWAGTGQAWLDCVRRCVHHQEAARASGDGSGNARAVLSSPAARFRRLVSSALGRTSLDSRVQLWNMGYSASSRCSPLRLPWKR